MHKLITDLVSVLANTWPIVFITTLSLITLRVIYLIKNKTKFILYEELLSLLFVIYLLVLFQIVTYQDVISYGNNFIPFKELTRYEIGTNLFYKNIIGNILLFVPYGFFSSYYLKLDKKIVAFIIVSLLSISIEGVQLLIDRCFDIDDILLNIIGGMIGYFLYKGLFKITYNMSKRTIGNILIFSIMALIIFLLYMMI